MRIATMSFYGSLFLTRFADQILLFLVPLVVFQLTGNVGWSGVAFFFETLPRFVAFPVCGMLCDRHDPLRLLRLSQFLRAVSCLAGISAFVVFGGVSWLIGLSAVSGVLTTQGVMAREVVLPQLFGGERYRKSLSYTQIADQVGTVLGPLFASLLLGLWPAEGGFIAAAVLFLLADGLVMLWERLARPQLQLQLPQAVTGHFFMPLFIAARHILTLPRLRELILLTGAANLILGVTLATSAAMVTGVHGASGHAYAAVQAAGAVATVLTLLWTAHGGHSLRTLGIIATVCTCLGGFLCGLAPGFALYSVGFVFVIGFDKMFSVFIRSLRQQIIPAGDFGKTTGLIVLLNNLSQPLAGLIVAGAAGLVSTGLLITLLTAAASLLCVVAALLLLRIELTPADAVGQREG
jgi:MFS family permease